MSTKKTITSDLSGNIDLGFSTKKKKFSVGGDTSKIIEFDPTDLGVVNRLSKSMDKLSELDTEWEKLNNATEKITEFSDGENTDLSELEKNTQNFSSAFDKIEKNIRDVLDYIFDSDVSDTLLGNTSAYSIINGKFKYEHIIEAMLGWYAQNVKDEVPKFNSRKVNTYTHKYIKK